MKKRIFTILVMVALFSVFSLALTFADDIGRDIILVLPDADGGWTFEPEGGGEPLRFETATDGEVDELHLLTPDADTDYIVVHLMSPDGDYVIADVLDAENNENIAQVRVPHQHISDAADVAADEPQEPEITEAEEDEDDEEPTWEDAFNEAIAREVARQLIGQREDTVNLTLEFTRDPQNFTEWRLTGSAPAANNAGTLVTVFAWILVIAVFIALVLNALLLVMRLKK